MPGRQANDRAPTAIDIARCHADIRAVSRWIRITAAIFLAVLVMAVAGVSLRNARDQITADRANAGAPQAVPSGDEAKYHELAERLLNFGYSPTGPTSVTLLPGGLPTDPAITLPNVNGARLIGSALRTRGSDRSADIVLDAPGDPEQVANAYEQGFKDQGWDSPQNAFGIGGGGGGFQGATPPVSRLLCKGENALINVMVSARPGSPNDVRINLQPNLSNLGGSACSAKAGGPGRPSNHLPAIRPPDGATLSGGGGGSSSSIGGGSSGSRQSSEGTAMTSLSSGELEVAFAKQLTAAGWTRLAGRDDGALAWSTWSSNEAGWSGSLIVADTGAKDRRSLLLRAEGPAN